MGVLTAGSSSGSFISWGAGGLDFAYKNDLALVEALREEADQAGVPLRPIGEDGYDLDWGVLVPVEDGMVYANGLDDIVRMPFDIAAMFAGGRVPSGRVADHGPAITFHLPDGRVVMYPKSLVAALVADRHTVDRGNAGNRDGEHEGGGGAQ